MQIKKFTPTDHKVKALVYGASGSGKTTFAGTAKNALFLSAEGGLLSIAEKGVSFVEISSMKDLIEALSYLKKNPAEFDSVVIDSISEINDIIIAEIEKRTGKSMQLQNWGELSSKIRKILREFRDLPIHVVFIALEKNITDDTKIQKIVPEIAGKAATGIAAFMDIVGYVSVQKDGTRAIFTNSQNMLLTKDRSSVIGDDTEPDFQVWIEKISKIKTGEQEVLYSDILLPEQDSRITSLWDEYILEADKDKQKSDAIKAATIQKKFGKSSQAILSKDEAEDLITALSNLVTRTKAEKMKKEEEEVEYLTAEEAEKIISE